MPAQDTITASINRYLDEVRGKLTSGVAREHAYRPALQALLESIDEGLQAVNEPAHTEVGAPDFVARRGEVPIGYVECKDVGKDLDEVEASEQIARYHALGNLILTDYVEFRWYVDGEKRLTARLGSVAPSGIRADREGKAAVADLLTQFAMQEAMTVGTAGELARWMARITREVDRLILRTYEQEGEDGPLHTQKVAFQQALIPDLSAEQFSDMYAQTMAYGLFAAAVRWDEEGREGEFTRWTVEKWLPPTNPFLRKLFHTITGTDLPLQVSWLVEEGLVGLLKRADLGEIVRDFGKATRQDDPVVHFYEDFLAAYDPALRERRGVYYTPEPVVSYIVRSVDWLLKEKFGRPDGLADEHTLVLDPAVGTGTFLYFVIQLIHERLVAEQGQAGAWDEYVRTCLLPRIFGFELLMAPYAVAHMKLGLQLQETGYTFGSDQRLGIYLTNTLEEAIKATEALPFLQYISEESHEAAQVKRDKPIMVVLGNPPYSGHSANKGEWIDKLIRDYYFVDGEPLGERNPKWLQDDYVKFIRFGQWRIERTGEGILAFVTNHGYLDNPTFRGMRQQLLQTFDEIYIIDLHGSTLRRDTAPDGGIDENVFDIRPGVAIAVLVKLGKAEHAAKLYHADLWGKRENKYEWLHEHTVNTTDWFTASPDSPFYLFTPQDIRQRAEYMLGWQITDLMPLGSIGIVTGQDSKTIAYSTIEASDLAKSHDLDARVIEPIYYRPFDGRYITYDSSVVTRQRHEVMQHMLSGLNLGLCTNRQVNNDFRHALCATDPIDGCTLSSASRERTFLFPLYLYPDPTKLIEDFDWPPGENGRRPNLNPDFVHELAVKLGLTFVTEGKGDLTATFGPEDVFDYIYAVFHSPTYRERYAEFLRIDFPRVPLTDDRELFASLAGMGAELVSLHLLKHPAMGQFITSFPVEGNNQVAKGYPHYAPPGEDHAGRVTINKAQYFEGISPELWDFHIGGYQVLHKWLKDRRGRELSWAEVKHYQQIVVALTGTMRLMGEIDAAIDSHGGWPLGGDPTTE